MRFLVTAAACLGLVLPMAAEAQTSRLPRKSVNERQVEDINRNIRQEQRLKNLEGQIQVEQNLMRQNIDRQRLFSTTPSPFRNCPVGAAGC
ncbi:NfeD family protein [Microvirga pakistanensis]|uniref:NfeD family protein n=1 Tax=Microvirga pakistanensis TaxID=1682650 RepID=UPI00106D3BE7|nr:NfeD family protein [Microvirga pakistanensis]